MIGFASLRTAFAERFAFVGFDRAVVGILVLWAMLVSSWLVNIIRSASSGLDVSINLFGVIALVGAGLFSCSVMYKSRSITTSLLGYHLLVLSISYLAAVFGKSDIDYLTEYFLPLASYFSIMTMALIFVRSQSQFRFLGYFGAALLIALMLAYVEHSRWTDYLYSLVLLGFIHGDFFDKHDGSRGSYRNPFCDTIQRAANLLLSSFDIVLRIVMSGLARN